MVYCGYYFSWVWKEYVFCSLIDALYILIWPSCLIMLFMSFMTSMTLYLLILSITERRGEVSNYSFRSFPPSLFPSFLPRFPPPPPKYIYLVWEYFETLMLGEQTLPIILTYYRFQSMSLFSFSLNYLPYS